MGKRNYLIEGVSGTGKSSVCEELRRRGYAAIHGDRELAYQGDPTTGEKTEGRCHEHHIWDVEKVRRLAANQDNEVTFFCGGSRNFKQFIDVFDEVFILDIDADTLNGRLDSRPDDDWGKRAFARLTFSVSTIPEIISLLTSSAPNAPRCKNSLTPDVA